MHNQLFVDRDFGWFVGVFENNKPHRHYAIQLSIPLSGTISVRSKETTLQTAQPVVIKSDITHQLSSKAPHFLYLVNPASLFGHYWANLAKNTVQEIPDLTLAKELQVLAAHHKSSIPTLKVNALLEEFACQCLSEIHEGDDRIIRALAYLALHSDRVVPLQEVAQYCHLSPSRFLHLFKEQTGITYRRAQLWNKVSRCFKNLGKVSLTELAHQHGFSDSAHLSKTFKDNFGFSPSEFLKISQFIQA